MAPGVGLVPPETPISIEQLRAIAHVPVDEDNPVYRNALLKAARLIDEYAGPACIYVLLGSIASAEYASFLQIFSDRLVFPVYFVGRGVT